MPFEGSDIIKAAKEFSLEKPEESLQKLMLRKFKTSLNPFEVEGDEERKILFGADEKYEIREFIRTILSDEMNETFDLDELSKKVGLERTGYAKFRFPEYGHLVEKEEAEKLFYQNLLGHLFDGELFASHVNFAKGEYWVNTKFSDFLLFTKLHTLKLSKEIPKDYEYKSFLGLVKGIAGIYDDISKGIRILNNAFKTIESSKNGIFIQNISQNTKNEINSFTSRIAPISGSGSKVDSVDDIIQKLGFAKDKKDWIWIKASDYLRAQVTEKTEAEKTEAEKIEAEKKEIKSNFFYQRLLLSNLVNPKDNPSPIVVSSNFPFNSDLFSESGDESKNDLLGLYDDYDDRLKNICLYVIFGKLKEDNKIPPKYSEYSSFVKWVNEKIMTKESSDSGEAKIFSMKNILDKIEEELEKEELEKEQESAITIQKIGRGYNARTRVKELRKEKEEEERLKREEEKRLESKIAGNQNERTTDSSEIEWQNDKRSISFQDVRRSHFLIPEITGRDPDPVTQYEWGFPVFNYNSLNHFSQDVDAAANKTYEVGMIANEMHEAKNNEDNNSLSSIACIHDMKTDKEGNISWEKRYCVVTSSSVGVTKNFISETDFAKIVNEASDFYHEALYETQVEVADDTKTDLESHSENDEVEKKLFVKMAEHYKEKKELEEKIKENKEFLENSSKSLAKLRVLVSGSNGQVESKTKDENLGSASSEDGILLDDENSDDNYELKTLVSKKSDTSFASFFSFRARSEKYKLSKDSPADSSSKPTAAEEKDKLLKEIKTLESENKESNKRLQDIEDVIEELWENIEENRSSRKDSQTKKTSNQISSAKKSSSSQPLKTEEEARLIASKKLSRVMAKRVETSIENGRNYRLDSSEVEGIAEDMAKAHQKAVYLYTEEKEEDCKRNVSKLLKSPSPRTSSNGVSFLRPRGNKNIVLVDFNFSEVQEGTPLAGNNEAYVYITGTNQCYVRCQVCKKDGEWMTFYKDGKLISERHNRGDVVIDQNTVSFLNEKTGEYTHVNASIYGLREHLNSSGKKNPGIAEAIIGQLKDIQIRATSHIDSAKSGEEPNVASKVAIMHRGISLSYNGDSDKKTIAKKKIVKKISMIKDDGSIIEIDAKNKFEISDNKVKDNLETIPQYVKMNDILDSDGNCLLTPYLKIEVKDEKVIQGSELFFIGKEPKMIPLKENDILLKLREQADDEPTKEEEAELIKEASKIFQHASETIGKNTKLIFPNKENKKRVIGILPTDEEKSSSLHKSSSNLPSFFGIVSALNPDSTPINASSPVSKASSVDKKEKTGVTPSSSCIPLSICGIIPNLPLGR